MALQKANLEVNDMKRTYEKKYAQTLTSVKPTTLNLQTRGFAPPQTNLDEEIPRQAKGSKSENLLEKLISNPSSDSSTKPIQRKSQNRLKAFQTKISTPIQAKLNIGEPNDKYEKEADDTASKVVQQINSTSQDQSVQKQESMEEEDDLQMKPISKIQREESLEEEDELQMKSLVQRRENVGGGEASTDLESSIQSARGSGQSLDASLQAKMGQAMGADFSGVKVHTDSRSDQLNKSIQAKAFTTGQDVFFRQGAYDPSSQGGQELIAHELTHVVQQGGKKALQSNAAIQRYVEVSDDAQNYPVKKIKAGKKSRNPDNEETEEFFSRQVPDEDGEFTDDQGNPIVNIEYNSTVPLFVSDNSDLAIEKNAEAKVFFATKSLISSANKKLNGKVELRATNKYLLVGNGWSSKKLYQVEPIVVENNQQGLAVTGPQRCNEMAEFVSGKVGIEGVAMIQANEVLMKIMKGTDAEPQVQVYRQALSAWQKMGGAVLKKTAEDAMDVMIQKYKQMLNDPMQTQEFEGKLKKMNINQFMKPKVGDAIVTTGLYDSTDAVPDFLYHFATVVAKSGNDYITMENYARAKNAVTASGGDPLFFFKMYGTKKNMQSWYEKQEASGDFQGAVLSFVVN
ncbi:DUF4157 domain-containing protein [Pseudanabaena galeata UHCC 0370]|uniref:DUF4157 domain-containing protein n=1 Tax=Pseudanabaena galeata UHCC 0370 TaxID=3110310 RepID=A0ABU5TDN9_9CYAN|nr:DUF4157 domain-containing protein [Pseudanabaena galeata]MEA5476392.1 DUF4157 domain-containing protein [Pseudanabaena galeata UHCC 0370]